MSGNVAPASRFLLASGIASDMSRTVTPEMARLSLSPFIPVAEEKGESIMVVRGDIAMGGTFTTIAPQLMRVVRLLEWGIITFKAVLLPPDHIGRIVKRRLKSGTCGGSKLEG
jgi:hypothetical protein